jgi:hypothetical protein
VVKTEGAEADSKTSEAAEVKTEVKTEGTEADSKNEGEKGKQDQGGDNAAGGKGKNNKKHKGTELLVPISNKELLDGLGVYFMYVLYF